MNRNWLSLVFVIVLGWTATAAADDPIAHFKGKPAETLAEAVANFSEYNARLAEILEAQELTALDLGAIHELTYTLEIALEKINEELAELADTLEELHVASETADYDGARSHGAAYLETARTVIP